MAPVADHCSNIASSRRMWTRGSWSIRNALDGRVNDDDTGFLRL
jgi:hypothetical protein